MNDDESLGGLIDARITALTGNNTPPSLVHVVKIYDDAFVDVRTSDNVILKMVMSSRPAIVSDECGLLLYPLGNDGKAFVLLF